MNDAAFKSGTVLIEDGLCVILNLINFMTS